MYKQTYNLGSYFEGKRGAFKRQSKLQYKIASESITSQIELKYFKYWEEVEFLIQYLNKERLEEAVYILAHSKDEIHKNELLTSVIAFYEINLFLDQGKTIFTHVLNEICLALSLRKYTFEKNNYVLKNLKEKYASKVSEFTRKLIKFNGISEYYDKYYYNKIKRVYLEFYPDKEDLFEIWGPAYFSKILLGHRILQEMDDYANSLRTKEFTSEILAPKDVKLLGILFFNQYLDFPSQFKSSNYLSLNIIKSIDSMLSRQIVQKYRNHYNIQATSDKVGQVTLRHKKFISKLKNEFLLEKETFGIVKDRIVYKIISFWEFIENVEIPFITNKISYLMVKNPLTRKIGQKITNLSNCFLEWDIRKRRRNK